jgi:hypothetical protein
MITDTASAYPQAIAVVVCTVTGRFVLVLDVSSTANASMAPLLLREMANQSPGLAGDMPVTPLRRKKMQSNVSCQSGGRIEPRKSGIG